MTKKEKLAIDKLKVRLNEHIKKYGMTNGYSTSFGDSYIKIDSHYSMDLTLPHCNDMTIGQIKQIGFDLYEDLRQICINYMPHFVDKIIHIYSTYIEDGCSIHYIEIIHRERV